MPRVYSTTNTPDSGPFETGSWSEDMEGMKAEECVSVHISSLLLELRVSKSKSKSKSKLYYDRKAAGQSVFVSGVRMLLLI
jgi:hypothetical protein